MKHAIVTGGSGVLGKAVVSTLEALGWSVVSIGSPTSGGPDLSDLQSAEAAFMAAERQFGGPADVLINAAGAFVFENADGSPTAWEAMFVANLKTCANMCRIAVGRLRAGGAIVNVGAAAAARAGAGLGPYAASKSGVARLTESLAAEMGGRIRVNAVMPLVLDTPRNRLDMPDADWNQWTAPAAVADVIAFLLSPASRAIDGALIPVTAASHGRG